MSKRLGSSNEEPLPKRSRRKPAGFRLARPAPESTASSNTSLFVTVTQPDQRRGILQAENRVLFSMPVPSVVDTPNTSTQPLTLPPDSPGTTESVEPYNDPQNIEPGSPEQLQTSKIKRKRNTTNAVCYYRLILLLDLTVLQHQLTEWIKFRAAFLDEALRHDGLGDFFGQNKCSNCGNRAGIIKCKDCSSGGLLKCPECVVALHQTLPLHRIEVSSHVF